jgi:hypothetical protein
MSGRGAALGGEREVAPLRRFEVEHGGTGHLELGRAVIGLGVLGRAGDGVDEPALEVGGKTEERPLHRPDLGEICRDVLVTAAFARRQFESAARKGFARTCAAQVNDGS